jgi:hypothetical protein
MADSSPLLSIFGVPVESRDWIPRDTVMLVSVPNPAYPVEDGYDPLDPRRWQNRVAIIRNLGAEEKRLGGR